MRYPLVIAATMALCLPAAGVAAGFHVEPGFWEILVTLSMPGIPTRIPPQTVRKCITSAQAAHGLQQMMHPPAPPRERQQCKLAAVTTRGRQVRYQGRCTTPMGHSRFSGQMTYDSAVQFHGEVETETHIAGRRLQLTEQLQGHRVAAVCPR